MMTSETVAKLMKCAWCGKEVEEDNIENIDDDLVCPWCAADYEYKEEKKRLNHDPGTVEAVLAEMNEWYKEYRDIRDKMKRKEAYDTEWFLYVNDRLEVLLKLYDRKMRVGK
jgi:DNA-directed RNA polymerase subunit RPC12/RpoP